MAIDTFFTQHDYGGTLTLNLTMDPNTFDTINFKVVTKETEIIDIIAPNANLDIPMAAVNGVWPVVYTFQAGELSQPGAYRAYLCMEDPDGAPPTGTTLTSEIFIVNYLEVTPDWVP